MLCAYPAQALMVSWCKCVATLPLNVIPASNNSKVSFVLVLVFNIYLWNFFFLWICLVFFLNHRASAAAPGRDGYCVLNLLLVLLLLFQPLPPPPAVQISAL